MDMASSGTGLLMTTDKHHTNNVIAKPKTLSVRSSSSSPGTLIISNFLSKCGLVGSFIETNSTGKLNIKQELAKLASIPKDHYEFDSFWLQHQNELPKLSQIARKYLSIPSTSVPSESSFSISNYILRKNRLSLSSKNVKYTMFLKDKF